MQVKNTKGEKTEIKRLFWWVVLRKPRANFWVGSLGPCAQHRASLDAWADCTSHKTLMLSISFVFSSSIKKEHTLYAHATTAVTQVLALWADSPQTVLCPAPSHPQESKRQLGARNHLQGKITSVLLSPMALRVSAPGEAASTEPEVLSHPSGAAAVKQIAVAGLRNWFISPQHVSGRLTVKFWAVRRICCPPWQLTWWRKLPCHHLLGTAYLITTRKDWDEPRAGPRPMTRGAGIPLELVGPGWVMGFLREAQHPGGLLGPMGCPSPSSCLTCPSPPLAKRRKEQCAPFCDGALTFLPVHKGWDHRGA